MAAILKKSIKSACNALGIEVRWKEKPLQKATGLPSGLPPDFDSETIQVIQRVRPFTMTSAERIASLCNAVRYVVGAGIRGDIVECGVWKGGSMMAVAIELMRLDNERMLHLFDTFDGMSEPSAVDTNLEGEAAAGLLESEDKNTSHNWAYCPEADVLQNLRQIGYPERSINIIKGKVEDTIPSSAPERIAILRLDTDWYESTKHELVHLFPRLESGGVLIIDDYGHWMGARKAVDEYFYEHGIPILLNRIDYTGRIAIKCTP